MKVQTDIVLLFIYNSQQQKNMEGSAKIESKKNSFQEPCSSSWSKANMSCWSIWMKSTTLHNVSQCLSDWNLLLSGIFSSPKLFSYMSDSTIIMSPCLTCSIHNYLPFSLHEKWDTAELHWLHYPYIPDCNRLGNCFTSNLIHKENQMQMRGESHRQ